MSTKNRKQKKAALLETKDEDVTIIDEAAQKIVSKKRTNSDRDESKRRSTRPNSNIEPPKKKQKRDKSKKAKSFFEDEAEEGQESDHEETKQIAKESETYSKEFLRPKASRLDNNMVDDLMDKYKDNEDAESDASGYQIKEFDPKLENDVKHIVKQMSKEELDDDVSRDICLPSIKDSKIWRIKVTPGQERALVFKITNKLIDYLNMGNPLNVLEVFESQLSEGIIYCEAYKSQHVEKVLQGLTGVQMGSVKMIPINEMTEVMKGCKVTIKQRFQEHQWVRIKGGIYKDDLGLIESVDGNKKAMVRLIPRIPEEFYHDPTKTLHSLKAYNKKSQFIRIPKQLFNPLRVKNECQKEYIRSLRKNFYVWRKMMFRNGFLYQEFNASKLITENVCPSLQEVKMFQVDQATQSHLYEFDDDDQDEWDLLDDETLGKTIRDDPQLQIQIGDRVKVTEGQFKDCNGLIKQIHDGYVHFLTEDSKPVEVKAKAFHVRKCFKIGESVRIIQGNRAGEEGIVTKIVRNEDGLDSHAIVTMIQDTSTHDLTVLINNLRIKQEIDPNTQSSLNTQFFQKNMNHINYFAGDLILYENYSKLGIVIQTSPESLKVLTTQNKFENIKINDVTRKIEWKPKTMVSIDMENNVLGRGTIVKIRNKSDPMFGQIGEIRCLFKDTLFLWIKNNQLSNSNGIYCVTSKQVVNAGAQHLKEANVLAGSNQGDGLEANMDRLNRDTTLRDKTVMITKGALKGYKGTVVYASETVAHVHIHSKCEKYTVPIKDIFIVYNEMEGVRIQQNAMNVPVHLSFDEAANQEYVNVMDQDAGWGAGNFGSTLNQNVQRDFKDGNAVEEAGDQTPVGSLLGADEVNGN